MAQKNASNFLTDNKLSVDQVEVFNKKTAFVTPLVDSAIQQLVITVTAVSESALAQGSATLPAHSIIHEMEAVCTTAFALDGSTLMSLNVGSASLGATGGTVANIYTGADAAQSLALMSAAGSAIAVGDGFSTRGKISAALGSTKTGSFASVVKGNHFYTSDQTIHAQLSSSAAAKRFTNSAGVLKVSILYSKVL
tara:strand:- start:172 stop:756 length:585 start_codon:yes stop_codon:yes gene_type:complete